MELLQLWQSIDREATELAEAVGRVPDHCECGDGQTHLEGRCPCCGTGSEAGCGALLGRLQADLAMLSEDLTLAGPPTDAAALEKQHLELRRGVFLAASDLERIVETFNRLSGSVAGFRTDCAVSRMRAIKRHCADLKRHCESVTVELTRRVRNEDG